MKLLYKTICCFLLLFTVGLNSMAQYVTLQGRQFKDENGNDFYPLMIDYNIEMVNDDAPACLGNYHFATSLTYGNLPNAYKCNEFGTSGLPKCSDQIDADLQHIKDLGFNAVNIVGLNPWSDSPSRFSGLIDQLHLAGFQDPPDEINWPLGITDCPFATPLNTGDPLIQIIFTTLDRILLKCDAIGLKVIIATQMGDGVKFLGSSLDNDYLDYLTLLSTHISGLDAGRQSAFFAYILAGEPTDPFITITKQDVCEITKEWYQRIKLNDPNHLVGSGGFYFLSVFEFDPGVVNMDFYEFHIYPHLEAPDGVSETEQVNRMKSIVYWIANNCPVAWMVGETGFAANSVSSDIQNSFSSSATTRKIKQRDYFQEIMTDVRNCGGSGFTMWQYQDVRWGDYSNAMGILNHGNTIGSITGLIKQPLGTYIDNYLDLSGQPPPPNPSLCVEPPNYYNPYVFASNPATITDAVKNLDGSPIKDAPIQIISQFYPTAGPPYIPSLFYHYTFSDNSGSFSAIPRTNMYKPSFITDLKISVITGDRIERGWNDLLGLPVPPGTPVPSSGETFFLKQSSSWGYNENINSIIVSTGNVQNFQSGLNLTANDVTIQNSASSDFTARENIHINSEFNAINGSEVHIYTSETFPDCNEFSGYKNMNNPPPQEENNLPNIQTSKLELKFKRKVTDLNFIIQPNPNNGKFSLVIEDSKNTEIKATILIYNLIGEKVYTGQSTELVSEMNLSDMSKGVYYVKIINNQKSAIKKLIIQ